MTTQVVNVRTKECDVRIGRGSRWGNPFTHLPLDQTRATHQVVTVEESITNFREWVTSSQAPEANWIRRSAYKLRGKTLGCYCKPGPCHGDVLAWLAEMRRWKAGTLVTGRLVTAKSMFFVYEGTCREHVFELTERARRANTGTGWVQPARCIVCTREVPPVDIEWWQERCRGPHVRRARIDIQDMIDTAQAALDRLSGSVQSSN